MKKISILLFSLCLVFNISAQNEYDDEVPQTDEEEFVGFNKKNKNRQKKDLSRIKIGGTMGFGLANNQLSFNISPMIGYQIIEDRLEVGTGIIYGFYRYKTNNPSYKYTENTIGTNNYLRVYVWSGLFAQLRGEYKKIYAKDSNNMKAELKLGNIYGGAGYSIPIGDRAAMNLGLEINLIEYDPNISNYKRVLSPFFNFQYSL